MQILTQPQKARSYLDMEMVCRCIYLVLYNLHPIKHHSPRTTTVVAHWRSNCLRFSAQEHFSVNKNAFPTEPQPPITKGHPFCVKQTI